MGSYIDKQILMKQHSYIHQKTQRKQSEGGSEDHHKLDNQQPARQKGYPNKEKT